MKNIKGFEPAYINTLTSKIILSKKEVIYKKSNNRIIKFKRIKYKLCEKKNKRFFSFRQITKEEVISYLHNTNWRIA